MGAEDRSPFDPAKHMIRIRIRGGGQTDYLPARARILWIRHDHPTAQIVTELVFISEKTARVRCTITLPDGAVATAHASENADAFPDYLEKAETSAVSRACALMGYGTEGAVDVADRLQVGAVMVPPSELVVTVHTAMIPEAQAWLRRELGRLDVKIPQKFERWGDVIGAMSMAGLDVTEVLEEGGVSPNAVKQMIQRLHADRAKTADRGVPVD